jgi:putative phosphoesterase
MARLAVLSDVHGNAPALAAARKAIKSAKPDAILIAGDLVLNGPDPVETLDGIRDMEATGALVIQGNTDIAVADFDYSAAFPWMTEGVPESIQAASQWAHEQLDEERLDWLRGLPAERRIRLDDVLVLVCHASPGSQTSGFDRDLDPSVTIERAARTDAQVICCGHTHQPEVRDLGWKRIVNAGSAGYVFDGDPTASWALVDVKDGEVSAEIRRAEFDVMAVSEALSRRALPGDIYRAATVRTGKLVR